MEIAKIGVKDRVLLYQFSCLALDLLFRKNEARFGGIPGKSFVLMAQEDLGRFGELAALEAKALFLDFAELIEGFLELTGEA